MTELAGRPRPQTEAEWIIQWIEEHCLRSNGTPAVLTFAQKETLRRIYDDPNGADLDEFGPLIERGLRTYLALCYLCGIRAEAQTPVPVSLQGLSLFALWGAAGPALKDVLQCRSGAITCPGLGTRYEAEPDAAA
jgi:hypothetical protein